MREVLCTEGTTAAFSGNLQGRHVRETGPKGVYLATLRPGEQAELEFVVLDVARWESLEIDLTEATDYSDVVSRAKELLTTARTESGKRPLVARLTLVGATEVASELTDSVQVREDLEAVAERLGVALEKIRNRTRIPEVAPGLAAAHQDKLAEIAQSADFDEAAISKLLVKVRSATSAPLRELGIDGEVSLAEVPALALERLKSELGGEA